MGPVLDQLWSQLLPQNGHQNAPGAALGSVFWLSCTCLGPVLGCLGPVLDLSWTYLGLSWTALDMSWNILSPGGRLGTLRDLLGPILGSFWGPTTVYVHFVVLLGVIFWTSFRTICGPILVHFGTRSAQAGAKMGPRGPSRASKTQRGAFAQIQKTFSLWRFLGSKAAQDGLRKPKMDTQDATEGLQNHKKKASKNGPNFYQFLDHLRGHSGVHFGARIDSKVGPKMGQVFLTHRSDPPSCTRWPRAAPLALPKVGSACLGLYDKNGKPVLQS